MRDRYEEVSGLGAEIVAIGTGDRRYAEAFVAEEKIPFLVLVDDDAIAASAASIREIGWLKLLHPKTWKATRETSKRGYHIHKAGKRVRQIGATFVIGKGNQIRYQHIDDDSTDHADINEIVAALSV